MTPTAIEPKVETMQLELQAREFRVAPESLDADRRTFEMVWSTGAPVRRNPWFSDAYDEHLSLDPKHIRLDRLNGGGAPFLESHSSYGLRSVLGKIEPNSVRFEGGKAYATVRFSRRDDVQGIFGDVADGILGNVSVGYRVHGFEDITEKGQEVKQYRAIDWEPYEVSLVPMGADPGSQIRSFGALPHECRIVSNNHDEQRAMPEPTTTPTETPTEVRTAPTDPAPTPAPEPVDVDAIRAEARAAERERQTQIRDAARKLGLSGDAVEQRLIDEGLDIGVAREALIEAAAAQSAESEVRSTVTATTTMGTEAHEKRIEAASSALMHRCDPNVPLEGDARNFRGLSLMEMGSDLFDARGVSLKGQTRSQRAQAIIGVHSARGGAHTTSDFPKVYENVLNKSLRRGYEEWPQTYQDFVRITSANDFREIVRVQIGEAPMLKLVDEHGEYEYGTLGDASERYRVHTYGRIVAMTWQMLINDDLDALSRIPGAMGRQSKNLESDIVWDLITSNPIMADGNALFSVAHANINTGLLDTAGLSTARKTMKKQKGLDGTTRLNLSAAGVMVPTDLQTQAEQTLVLGTSPREDGQTNPFKGTLGVITEQRLDDTSVEEWYAHSNKGQIDIIELAFLDGMSMPQTFRQEGFDMDALKFKIRHNVGGAAIDWRGLYKSDGQAA